MGRLGVSQIPAFEQKESSPLIRCAPPDGLRLLDFSAAPWQGFEKSERGPNSSSLFQPQAAVVAVAVQVLLSAEDVSRKALCEYRFNQRGTGDSPAAVVLLLDIPRGWKPRAKQQPTGLIACGAAHRRPVQVLFRTEKKKQNTNVFCFFLVRIRGLEPPPSCPD